MDFGGTTAQAIEPTPRVVRRYSLQAPNRIEKDSDAYHVAQFLQESIAQDPDIEASQWRRFFDPAALVPSERDVRVNVLEVESRRLVEKYTELRQSQSREQDPTTFNPTISNLVQTINELKEKRQEKNDKTVMGRARKRFHKFCGLLGSHASLIRIIPEGNQYVGIFVGVLNAVIQASERHQESAEKLAEALCRVSEDIEDCEHECRLYQTEDLITKIAELYADVFLFLADYMEYLRRKIATRIRHSFNENIDQKIDDHVKAITTKTARIRYAAERSGRSELRTFRLDQEHHARTQRAGLKGQARMIAEMMEEMRFAGEAQSRQESLMRKLIGMLCALREQGIASSQTEQLRVLRGPEDHLDEVLALPPACQIRRLDVLVASKHLEDCFRRQSTVLFDPGAEFRPAACPPAVLGAIITWLQDEDSSKLLWLDGPPLRAAAIDNPISLIAGALVGILARLKQPLMSYFCGPLRNEASLGNESTEGQYLVAVAVAIIRQAMELLMPSFSSSADFSAERLARLDGTLLTWDSTMSLLRELLSLVPRNSLCILDGLEWIDGPTNAGQFKDLIDALRDSGLRVLLATSGRAPTLRSSLRREETVPSNAFDMRRAKAWLSPRIIDLDQD